MIESPVLLIRRHLQAYLFLNLLFFGLVVAGAIYSFLHPGPQRELTHTIGEAFNAFPLSLARDAYLSRNVAVAAAATFAINSLFGSFLALTVPSLLIPFAGAFIGFFRALTWGVALSPSSPDLARAMVPHSLTLLLEGEAYVLAIFGVHLLWTSSFNGLKDGLRGLWKGYLLGLRANLAIYALVLLTLAVSAVYEAFEVIYLVGIR